MAIVSIAETKLEKRICLIVCEAALGKAEFERRVGFWLQVVSLGKYKCQMEPYKVMIFLVKSNYMYNFFNPINLRIQIRN